MSDTTNCVILDDLNVEEVLVSQEQYNYILNIQKVILEKVAERGATTEILDTLCSMAESLLPNSVASIMLKDPNTGLMDMIHAPSVPKEGLEKFKNLKPGPGGEVHVGMQFTKTSRSMCVTPSRTVAGKTCVRSRMILIFVLVGLYQYVMRTKRPSVLLRSLRLNTVPLQNFTNYF